MSLPIGSMVDSLETAAGQFAALDLRLVSIALALQLGGLALRALALRNVLAAAYPDQTVSRVTVGAVYAAGAALNAFAPARGGDALKVALLRMRIPGSSVPTIAAAGLVLALLDAVIGSAVVVVAWSLGVIPALPTPSPPSTAFVAAHPFVLAGSALALAGALAVVAHPLARHVRGVWVRVEQGAAILRTPSRYLREVAAPQAAAWACRIGVAYCLLAAFGLTATVPLAMLVVVAGGLSTVVPTPGGAGTQQLLLVYALRETATAAAALSFSVGMQVGITTVNTFVGLCAVMILFRTLRPATALRAVRTARAGD
jgi:uncharacterized membrane protein YbhN (UPF0104 family)